MLAMMDEDYATSAVFMASITISARAAASDRMPPASSWREWYHGV
jgi:hypothetical protein